MKWLMIALACLVLGVVVGLAIADQTFENPPQQIALVRKLAILAAALGIVYVALCKRTHGQNKGRNEPGS